MELKNTTLDDVSAVVGFSATLRLVAWFGDRSPMYVPLKAEDGQLLVKLVGLPSASALSREWPGEYLRIGKLKQYDVDRLRQKVMEMLVAGSDLAEISQEIGFTKRRVSQIRAELQQAKLTGNAAENAPEKYRGKSPTKRAHKKALKKTDGQSGPMFLPGGFFGNKISEQSIENSLCASKHGH